MLQPLRWERYENLPGLQHRVVEAIMRKLLVLLVALTVGCGTAASITISLAPAYADENASGY